MVYVKLRPVSSAIRHEESDEFKLEDHKNWEVAASGRNSTSALSHLVAAINSDEVDTENNWLVVIHE